MSYYPIFLDVHSIGTMTGEDLLKAQNAARDELRVKGVNILYNLEAEAIYCLLEASFNILAKTKKDAQEWLKYLSVGKDDYIDEYRQRIWN